MCEGERYMCKYGTAEVKCQSDERWDWKSTQGSDNEEASVASVL
jgi:hypothetical protein